MQTGFAAPGTPAGPPRDAATVVLLRGGAGGLEVLMVRRSKGSSFMADAFVFPGGRADATDESSHPLRGEEAVAADPRLPAIAADASRAVTLCVAAARELFEEAGVLLAVDEAGREADTTTSWAAEGRNAVHQGTRGFRELLAEQELSLAIDELTFFARWITPATEPKRFDARFYVARMPLRQEASHLPGELTELRWGTPRAILADYARGAIKLPPPTIWHLTDLAEQPSIDAALDWARAHAVLPVRPKLVPIEGAPAIVLPWDAEYERLPGEGEAIPRDHAVAGPVSRFVLVDGRWVARSVL
jgi:8-oxo-dGTP pyrophosphatase MutT (NUDIX family)